MFIKIINIFIYENYSQNKQEFELAHLIIIFLCLDSELEFRDAFDLISWDTIFEKLSITYKR